ncbi:13125_t:CDS:2, partial [Dentiscutata heterogama]
LIATGTIESELHYGPYLLHYIYSPLRPGYICEGGGQSSDIVTSSSQAITSVYQAVFGTKTKIAGLLYLGLEQTQTFQKLLEGIIFCPFIIEIENLSIFVGSLAKQSVFFQSIKDDNLFSIVIYQNSQIVAEYKNNSPNTVWQQTGILKSILGDTLFAINHLIVLQKLDEAYNTKFSHQTLISDKCTLTDWNNKTIMRHLFDLYLKKAVSKSAEEWYKIFQNWKQQKSNIIELYTHFSKVYGSNYEFRKREVRAWRAIFCATGCTEITPYDKQISKNEFWTNVPDLEKDCATLKNLYEEGMLNVSSQNLTIKTFWDCFCDSYDANFRGADGKIAHAIKRYVRIGCELTNGTNIETALQDLSGTSVAHIEPNRNKTTKSSALSVEQDDIEINSESLK